MVAQIIHQFWPSLVHDGCVAHWITRIFQINRQLFKVWISGQPRNYQSMRLVSPHNTIISNFCIAITIHNLI